MTRESQAIFAHFDPDGLVAPHVRRHLAELAATVDHVVIVSTAPLTARSHRRLAQYGQVITRRNEGYDFASWREGILRTVDWSAPPRLVIGNDSTIGPLRPLRSMIASMDAKGADVWGATVSYQYERHLQSFYLVCDPKVVADSAFRAFWESMTPISKRMFVIERYELGFSRLMRVKGYSLAGYFEPTPREQFLCDLRHRRAMVGNKGWDKLRRPWELWRDTTRIPGAGSNPMVGLWDRAIPDGRLPFVKFDSIRDDPYHLGSEQMIARCEKAFPRMFDGVREYIDRTRAAYALLRA